MKKAKKDGDLTKYQWVVSEHGEPMYGCNLRDQQNVWMLDVFYIDDTNERIRSVQLDQLTGADAEREMDECLDEVLLEENLLDFAQVYVAFSGITVAKNGSGIVERGTLFDEDNVGVSARERPSNDDPAIGKPPHHFDSTAFITPCLLLNYCPYGELVELFPVAGLDDDGVSCGMFGHVCPVVYVAEDFVDREC